MLANKGFSIIELMICIAIIGILLSVTLPSGSKVAGVADVNITTGVQSKAHDDWVKHQTECIHGYLFFSGKQIIGENGSGVRC
jgi:prepilin-type N-terminal cleavage/methylation domain-containing protein